MKLSNESTVEEFALHFLSAKFAWRDIPKLGIINFGNIISICLFKQPPFQVEMFILPTPSSFPNHRHPNVDTMEIALAGEAELFVNDKLMHSKEQVASWLAGDCKALPVHIGPGDWHRGTAITPHCFLSIQKWLNDVEPTSVGLNWEGEPGSIEQAMMWQQYMT